MQWKFTPAAPNKRENEGRKRVLLMDVKAASNNVSRGHLIKRTTDLEIDPELIRWLEDFMSE